MFEDFSWRVSDCEELVGGYSQEMIGLVLGELCHFFKSNGKILANFDI